jgi:hypothetical protein
MQEKNYKNIIKFFKDACNHRLYKISNISKLCALSFSNKGPIEKTEALLNGIFWLCKAQDITACGGVSAGYSFKNGWESPYPETTGYIVETLYDFGKLSGDKNYETRACRMTEWLISIQMHSGSFQGGPLNCASKPAVFNTGMILFGLIRAYLEEGDDRFLTAARKAGNWLVESQDEDGAWRKNTFKGRLHAYKTRVAWALLELWLATSEPIYAESARKNLNWALLQQKENGFFEHMAFVDEPPYLHTIAYTIRGLLESGAILSDEKYINSALKTADRLFLLYELNRNMPGQFEKSFFPNGSYACLTGCAQLSIIWQRLYQILGDARYLNAGLKMNDFLIESQINSPKYPEINGSIMGSKPIWGGYMPYYFPNWAVKFFVDALLIESKILRKIEEK